MWPTTYAMLRWFCLHMPSSSFDVLPCFATGLPFLRCSGVWMAIKCHQPSESQRLDGQLPRSPEPRKWMERNQSSSLASKTLHVRPVDVVPVDSPSETACLALAAWHRHLAGNKSSMRAEAAALELRVQLCRMYPEALRIVMSYKVPCWWGWFCPQPHHFSWSKLVPQAEMQSCGLEDVKMPRSSVFTVQVGTWRAWENVGYNQTSIQKSSWISNF